MASVLQSWFIVSLPCTGHCSQHAMCIGVFNPYCHSRGSIFPLRRTRGQGGAGPAGGCAGSLSCAHGTGRMKKQHGPPPLLLSPSCPFSSLLCSLPQFTGTRDLPLDQVAAGVMMKGAKQRSANGPLALKGRREVRPR